MLVKQRLCLRLFRCERHMESILSLFHLHNHRAKCFRLQHDPKTGRRLTAVERCLPHHHGFHDGSKGAPCSRQSALAGACGVRSGAGLGGARHPAPDRRC